MVSPSFYGCAMCDSHIVNAGESEPLLFRRSLIVQLISILGKGREPEKATYSCGNDSSIISFMRGVCSRIPGSQWNTPPGRGMKSGMLHSNGSHRKNVGKYRKPDLPDAGLSRENVTGEYWVGSLKYSQGSPVNPWLPCPLPHTQLPHYGLP